MMFNECNGTGARDAMVYVVDDEASVRRALARLIHSAGYRVDAYGSAREFLEQALPFEHTAGPVWVGGWLGLPRASRGTSCSDST